MDYSDDFLKRRMEFRPMKDWSNVSPDDFVKPAPILPSFLKGDINN